MNGHVLLCLLSINYQLIGRFYFITKVLCNTFTNVTKGGKYPRAQNLPDSSCLPFPPIPQDHPFPWSLLMIPPQDQTFPLHLVHLTVKTVTFPCSQVVPCFCYLLPDFYVCESKTWFSCVGGVRVGVHMHVACTCPYEYVWRSDVYVRSLLVLFSTLILSQNLSLNLDLTVSARLSSQQALKFCLFLPPWC